MVMIETGDILLQLRALHLQGLVIVVRSLECRLATPRLLLVETGDHRHHRLSACESRAHPQGDMMTICLHALRALHGVLTLQIHAIGAPHHLEA